METRKLWILSFAGPEKEMREIGGQLVENNLAGCVQFFKMDSVYRWKGKTEKSNEVLAVGKTLNKGAAA